MSFWAARLRQLGVESTRTRRFDQDTLVLKDPDGIELGLVGDASDERWVPWPNGPVGPEHAIRGFHSVTLMEKVAEETVDMLTNTMGFRKTGQEGNRTRFETGGGGPDSVLDILEEVNAQIGEEACGTVHHVAWRATNDGHQLAWRDTLLTAGLRVTPVIERKYFRSIYFREPGGVLFEIATDQPGFTVDEAPEALGSGLQLPPQYEGRRKDLKFNLPPIVVPTTAATGAGQS